MQAPGYPKLPTHPPTHLVDALHKRLVLLCARGGQHGVGALVQAPELGGGEGDGEDLRRTRRYKAVQGRQGIGDTFKSGQRRGRWQAALEACPQAALPARHSAALAACQEAALPAPIPRPPQGHAPAAVPPPAPA